MKVLGAFTSRSATEGEPSTVAVTGVSRALSICASPAPTCWPGLAARASRRASPSLRRRDPEKSVTSSKPPIPGKSSPPSSEL